MAIIMAYSDDYGNDYASAYIRIRQLIIDNPDVGDKNATCMVDIYASKAKRTNGKRPFITNKSYNWIPAGGINTLVMADAYSYLKTLPEFSVATDDI